MKYFGTLLAIGTLLAFAAVTNLLTVREAFEDMVSNAGPDAELFYVHITETELRSEDPEGHLELLSMPYTSARDEAREDWEFRIRQRIFTRRHGRPFTGDKP